MQDISRKCVRAAAALCLSGSLLAVAAGPDMNVFGVTIGENLPAMPYCDMLNSYLAAETQKELCNLQSWSVVSPQIKPWGAKAYTLYLPTATRPVFVKHDPEFGDIYVFTVDDKVESVVFSTVGEKALAQAYGSLAGKYGKPAKYEKIPMQDTLGQEIAGIQALWTFPSLSIRLGGIRRDREWGQVEFSTPKYRALFDAWRAKEDAEAAAAASATAQ